MSKKLPDISNHAMDEYVRRIEGITDNKKRARVITTDRDKFEEHIHRLFKHSILVYQGQIGGNKTNIDYYLNNDIAILVNGSKGVIVTIYRIVFPFPPEASKQVIDSLKDSILELNEDIALMDKKIDEEKAAIDLEIEEHERIIEQKKREIEIEKGEIDALKSMRSAILTRGYGLNTQRENYATNLFGRTSLKVAD